MRKSYFTYIILFLMGMSCDKITPPFTEGCLNCCGDFNTEIPIKTILIEEFTGHKCSNCPNGTRIIENIKNTYCDHIIVLACHPFNQDFTTPNESGPLSTDFRTNETTEIGDEFGFWGFPSALVNRINNGYFFQPFELGEEVHNLLFDENNEPIPADLDINIYIPSVLITKTSEGFQGVVAIEIEKLTTLNEEYKLAVVISEDHIISGQYDGEQLINDYEHNHIYQTSLNGTWGVSIDMNQSNITTIHYPFSIIPESGNINNCSVIAYVYHENTKEIIQAAQQYFDFDEIP